MSNLFSRPANEAYLIADLTHDVECLLSILRSINEIEDPHTKSYLVDASELIGTGLLKKLEHNERIEDGE